MIFQRVEKLPEEPLPPLWGRCGPVRLVVMRAGEPWQATGARCGARDVIMPEAALPPFPGEPGYDEDATP